MNETLRVNGTAQITTDQSLLEPLAVGGRAPKAGILVQINEVYLHCAKALIRAKLWDPETQIDRKSFRSMGEMVADQIKGRDAEETDRHYDAHLVEELY